MTERKKAIFVGKETRPAGEYQGKAYPEKYILKFMLDNFTPIEFRVKSFPDWTIEPAIENTLMGTLVYDLVADNYNSRVGRPAYTAVYNDFEDYERVELTFVEEEA